MELLLLVALPFFITGLCLAILVDVLDFFGRNM